MQAGRLFSLQTKQAADAELSAYTNAKHHADLLS